MNKVFLLDAYALIYRSYYAFIKNPRINSKGLNTSAIIGFVNTLEEVLNKEHPTHIAVAFDPHGPTFRSDAYPAYKAQREKTPEDITRAIPIIKDLLDAYGIRRVEVAGYEADDVIGTLAVALASPDTHVYMLTPDKDYGQLVTDEISIFRPRHGGGYETMGPREVCAKHAIASPRQVVDILALMGDSADNFPGCPGVGEKTAAQLIATFGSVDELLRRTSELKGALKTKVEGHVDDIRLSHFLATIRTDVPVSLSLADIALPHPNEPELERIFAELEFRTLSRRVLNKTKEKPKTQNIQLSIFDEFTADGSESSKNASFERLQTVPHEYKLIDNEEDCRKICDFFLTKEFFVLDTETTSTHAIDAELVGFSLSAEPHVAFYVAVNANREEELRIVNIFKPLFENPSILKIGQNIKYDLEVLRNYNIRLAGPFWDTMIAHYLIQPEQRHNMDDMALSLLNYQTIHIDELIGPRGKGQRSMRDLKPTEVYEYACEDADITLQLKERLEPMLKASNCEQLFYEMEMPLMPVLAEMEINGVTIDTAALAQTSQELTARAAATEQHIYELAGMQFNIASPKQVGEVLFNHLKISEKPKKTKSGQFVTSEDELQKLRSRHEIVGAILDYRGQKKLLSTYIDTLPTLINPRTGHIHTSFNQTVTATGRLSSSDPNLQNIPVRGEDGKEIRRAFVAEPGCLFFSADYSQIELRIMAHLSQDEAMIAAFTEGRDVHASTAAKVYGKDIADITRDERTKAKRANFGIIYGITAFGLSESLNIARAEAQQLISGFFDTFPRVRDYMERAKQEARERGYVETLFGRRRYLPDINSQNATVRGFAERNAINAPIQGTAADIIKVAMVRIFRRFAEEGLKSKMILQVHDELNFSVYPEERDIVADIVVNEMEHAIQLAVPLIADSAFGQNWLEAH